MYVAHIVCETVSEWNQPKKILFKDYSPRRAHFLPPFLQLSGHASGLPSAGRGPDAHGPAPESYTPLQTQSRRAPPAPWGRPSAALFAAHLCRSHWDRRALHTASEYR